MRTIKDSIFLTILFLMTACQDSNHNSPAAREIKYTENFVESEKVKLHWLDWGGSGPVLVLIHGLGDTPFIFDSLAKGLSPHFRVIGYSKRNHGKSETREEKYDNETLVADLKLLLDSLKIDKANLLGWSMGGNEITGFASLYPDRVARLIYFEAGYDLSDGGFAKVVANIPSTFLPDSSVMKSLDNYREWYRRFWFDDVEWNGSLETNLRASVRVNSDGSVEAIPSDRVFKSMLTEAMNYKRNYEGIQSPSLIIYTTPFLNPAHNNPETIKLYDSIEQNIVVPWRLSNRERIQKELRNAIIVEAPKGSHTSFLFLSNDFLVETITSFIGDKK